MLKRLSAFVLASMLVFSIPVEAHDPNTADLILSKKDAVVAVFTARKIEAADDKPEKTGESLGTGFFIAENMIITNTHVLEEGGGKRIGIVVSSEDSPEMYEAEVVFEDPVSDVAVIKIKDYEKYKAQNKIAFLEPTEEVKQVEEVYVIGHPWGLFFTVSKGIVSSTMRKIDKTPRYMIQTDAHVFQGNSGGPLLNEKGQVIGINTAMLSKDGGSFGLAVPTKIIKKVLSDFVNYGEVRWARIGVAVEDKVEGIVVKAVEDNLPAALSGMKPGDVIKGITTSNGTFTPKNYAELLNHIAIADSSTPITVLVTRDQLPVMIKMKPAYRTAKDFKE